MTTFKQSLIFNLNNWENEDITTWAYEHVSQNQELAFVFAAAWSEQLQKTKTNHRVLNLFDLVREMVSHCRTDVRKLIIAAFLDQGITERLRIHSENFTKHERTKMFDIVQDLEEYFPAGSLSIIFSILAMREDGTDKLADQIFKAHEVSIPQPRRQSATTTYTSSSTERRPSAPLKQATKPLIKAVSKQKSKNEVSSTHVQQQQQTKPKRWHPVKHQQALTRYFQQFPKEFGCQFFVSDEKMLKFIEYMHLSDELSVASVQRQAKNFPIVKSEIKKEKNPAKKRERLEGPDLVEEPLRKLLKELVMKL